MKYVIVSMFVLLVWVPKIVRAQVIVKTGYISSSSYKGENLQSCIDTDFIRQFKPNLSLGAGLAINKSSHFIALCQ